MSSSKPSLPAAASALYASLFNTAHEFIIAQAQVSNFPSRIDFDRLRRSCTTDFQHSWGHNYAVSLAPPLQGTHSIDAFIAHLRTMLPKLESWKTQITDVIVDDVCRKVMLRVSFWMQPKGTSVEDAVENDILWVLEMSHGETDTRVAKSMEFIDGMAAGRLRELISKTG